MAKKIFQYLGGREVTRAYNQYYKYLLRAMAYEIAVLRNKLDYLEESKRFEHPGYKPRYVHAPRKFSAHKVLKEYRERMDAEKFMNLNRKVKDTMRQAKRGDSSADCDRT